MKRFLTYKLENDLTTSKMLNYKSQKEDVTFLGKIIRMPNNKIPARLLSAVCQGKRHIGRQKITTRHSILKDNGKIIPEVDKKGSFSSWAYIAYDKLAWSILINNLGSNNFKPITEWDGNTPDSPKFPIPSTSLKKITPNPTTSSSLSFPFSIFFSDV